MTQKRFRSAVTRLAQKRGGALAAFAVLALVVGGTVMKAGHAGGVSYTGCLSLTGGTITSIAEGNEPLRSCGTGTIEAHFGSGDITAVLAGTGLTGGGTSGSVTMAVGASYRLPQSCSAGQVAKWNGTGWACAGDSDSQYTAGTGLQLIGSEFSIAPDYRVQNNQNCGAGQFVSGLSSTGVLNCISAAVVQALVQQQAPGTSVPIPNNIQYTEVIGLDVPAGGYSITVIGRMFGPFDDAELDCELLAGASGIAAGTGHGHDTVNTGSISMMALRTFGVPVRLHVMCLTNDEGVSARQFGIQALRLY